MKKPKAQRDKGLYPNCVDHLTEAGLTSAEAAERAGVSPASIGRMKNGEPVLLTTIARVINMLNAGHFKGTLKLAEEAHRVNQSSS